jgi:hypothetical protein
MTERKISILENCKVTAKCTRSIEGYMMVYNLSDVDLYLNVYYLSPETLDDLLLELETVIDTIGSAPKSYDVFKARAIIGQIKAARNIRRI